MSFFDIFLSEKERARKMRRKRRQALRSAESAIDAVKERKAGLEKEASKNLNAARNAKKGGDNAAASRALVSARAAMSLAMKLEQKRWVFEQILIKMEVAGSDESITSAMAAMNKVVQIDPERVADVFDTAQEKLGEAVETEKFWGKMYEKEMEGATCSLEDYVPSIEDLDRQTDAEAAAEMGASSPNLDATISSGLDRVKKILEGK